MNMSKSKKIELKLYKNTLHNHKLGIAIYSEPCLEKVNNFYNNDAKSDKIK